MVDPGSGAPPADGRGGGRTSTRLLLVRHAVTAQTGPLLSGRTPGIDLSEAGREQAAGLAARLEAVPVDAVYASPMERTMQTAAPIAAGHGVAVRPVDGLIEADYGEWTGGALTDLARTELWGTVQRAPSRARFPAGEALTAMQARIVAALDALVDRHPGATVVAVSHADPLKAAVAHYTGLPLDLFQRIAISPASVTVLDVGPAGSVLLACNAVVDLASILVTDGGGPGVGTVVGEAHAPDPDPAGGGHG